MKASNQGGKVTACSVCSHPRPHNPDTLLSQASKTLLQTNISPKWLGPRRQATIFQAYKRWGGRPSIDVFFCLTLICSLLFAQSSIAELLSINSMDQQRKNRVPVTKARKIINLATGRGMSMLCVGSHTSSSVHKEKRMMLQYMTCYSNTEISSYSHSVTPKTYYQYCCS